MGKLDLNDLKLWVKKQKFIRKIFGEKKTGYYGRLITNGTANLESIAKAAAKNTTTHKAEIKMSLELALESVVEYLKMGAIVDLGPLGKRVPGVASPWYEDPDDLKLKDMDLKVKFSPSEELEEFFKGSKLHWLNATTADSSTGEPTDEEEPDIIDTPQTIDTSTATSDTSTGSDNNGSDDIPAGNG